MGSSPLFLPLGLVSLVALVSLAACGGGTESSRFVLRVDRTLDGSVQARVEPIDDTAYEPHEPRDRYDVVIDGDHVTVAPLADGRDAMEGTLVGTKPGESRYALDKGTFANGKLLIRGERAELTLYGSGVPIVSSERGALVRQ